MKSFKIQAITFFYPSGLKRPTTRDVEGAIAKYLLEKYPDCSAEINKIFFAGKMGTKVELEFDWEGFFWKVKNVFS